MAFEDAYLDLIEKYDPLLVEKETLEKGVDISRSNVEELTVEINCQLFLGFKIIHDVVKAITLDFGFKKLNEIAVAEAMHQAQAAAQPQL